MTWQRIHVLIILSLFLLWTGTALAQDAYTPPTDEPGPAVETLYFKAFNVDRAPLDLAAGEMDLYYYNLKIAAARELRDNDTVNLYEAPANTLSLLLNPAPAPEGELNPFSIPEVRRAMQRLVDRDFVVREIYQGQATPMYTVNSPNDFDYLTVFDIVQEQDLRYDPEFARDEIAAAMEEAGAELVDELWNFNGRPIRLKFIIRVEDERRELGDLVRAALGEAGFLVDANYQPFAPAIQTVYSTDPKQFSWHIYTEGWGRGAPNRYDFGSINSYNAPWLGNMPGWQQTGYWQYENEELDEIGKQIYRGEFADKGERDELYREMTRMGLDESIRVWVATVNSAYAVQKDVQGITQDIAAGPRGLWTLRTAYKEGSDALTVGHLWVWTERTTWNPVAGFGDIYSSDIYRQLSDPAMWNDPFTGIPEAFRIGFDVETAGPDGTLTLPDDAMRWDADAGSWATVEAGTEAISKVTFDYSKYFQAPFHHGQPISMADVIYSIYQGFDLSYNPDKARIETVLATTSRPNLETFKGFRVLDENMIEVYVDFWHFENNYIASYATPSSAGTPWELLYALDDVVFNQRRAAYSDIAAARFNVPWISLVLDRDARLVRRALLDLQRNESTPDNVFTMPGADAPLVDAATAVERYQAVLDWFDEHGHMIISNGPFFLARYDPPAQFAELTAFRDENYPFTAADLYKGIPQLISFREIDAGTIVAGEEYAATVTLDGPGAMGIEYLFIDAANNTIIDQGDAILNDGGNGDGTFTVALAADLTNQLDLGLYNLTLAAYSDELAQMTERTLELEVSLFGDALDDSDSATGEQQVDTEPTTAPDEEAVADGSEECPPDSEKGFFERLWESVTGSGC